MNNLQTDGDTSEVVAREVPPSNRQYQLPPDLLNTMSTNHECDNYRSRCCSGACFTNSADFCRMSRHLQSSLTFLFLRVERMDWTHETGWGSWSLSIVGILVFFCYNHFCFELYNWQLSSETMFVLQNPRWNLPNGCSELAESLLRVTTLPRTPATVETLS